MVCLFLSACADYTPKPMGYFRIDIPENEYRTFDTIAYPYSFELSKYAKIVPQRDTKTGDKYWLNIYYPQFKGTIYCSYKRVQGNLQELSEDSREFVYKHTIKADNISEQPFVNPAADKYGTLYRIEGNVASPMQFVLTDSTGYFFRGALYFNAVPNKDSIAPVLDFVSKDILVLMETFKHKKQKE
jgi:gliding motility-associated lipoprotein GldD